MKNQKIKEIKKECKKSVKSICDEIDANKKAEKKANKKRLKMESRRANLARRAEVSKLANWLTLDNAATIYPSIREENWDFVFRVSAVLKTAVDKNTLQQALLDLEPRFPSFFVKLKTGLFWNFFEMHDQHLLVEEEKDFPCARFKRGSNEHLIRVLYYNNRISVECFHALADGRSALKFLNSLIKRYIELGGVKIENSVGCLFYLDKPHPEELTDSFLVHSDNSKKLKHKEVSAYRIWGTEEEYGVVNSVIAEMSVAEIKELAKKYNAKMFEFLVAALGYAIVKRVPKSIKRKRPIKLSVPIDLRRFFESESLRNFSGYLNVEIPYKADYAFEEVIEIVKAEFSKITKERMQGFINSNVSMQKNILIKLVPLFIKNWVINMCFKVWGESYQTLAISNLGQNAISNEFDEFIDRFEFNLGRPKYNAKSVGIVSFGDKLVCVMSSKIKENTTEKDFFRFLAGLGAKINLTTNRRDIYE